MALPSMPSDLVSREFLRIAGGYGAPSLGTSPAGGLDIDNAGNFATDGDVLMNTLQLGANIIKNSDGETTITLDVNQNVTLENDLYFNGGGRIGTGTDNDLLGIADDSFTVNGAVLLNGAGGDFDSRINFNGGGSAIRVDAGLRSLSFGNTAPRNNNAVLFGGSFTSGGSSTQISALGIAMDIVGAAGDTDWQTLMHIGAQLGASVTTNGAGEAIGRMSSFEVSEPNITLAGADTLTTGVTVYIRDAPTEGANNYALWVDAGAVRFDGNVGINDATPSFQLDVNGDGQFVGKLTLGGGTDPPYVLYDLETRQSIIDRIKREVPKGKLGGAAMFFNSVTKKIEVFVPNEGKFYDLMGAEVAVDTPITKTFTVKDKWYYSQEHDELIKFEVPDSPTRYRIKDGVELDRDTGEFKDAEGTIIDRENATEIDDRLTESPIGK